MAQSLEQINQNLHQLEQQAIDLGEKLHLAHQGYRNVLSQAAVDQLIMACFTLCTEAYPEEFLKLSVNERHQLQTDIRAIAEKMRQDLRQVPSPQTAIEELISASSTGASASMFALPLPETLIDLDETNADLLIVEADEDEDDAETDDDANESDNSDPALRQSTQQMEAELRALFSLESLLSQRQPQLPQNPVEQVGFWHEQIETQVHQCLRQVSSDINQLIQQRKIIPGQIPPPILEAAAFAEGSDRFGKTPHLVRMILEAHEKPKPPPGKDAESRQPRHPRNRGRRGAAITIVTLQLHLSELEFHDTSLISWRNQIRALLKELKSLAKTYKKLQQQQAIAEARIAWRATWSND